jgi:hypothetical protein
MRNTAVELRLPFPGIAGKKTGTLAVTVIRSHTCWALDVAGHGSLTGSGAAVVGMTMVRPVIVPAKEEVLAIASIFANTSV